MMSKQAQTQSQDPNKYNEQQYQQYYYLDSSSPLGRDPINFSMDEPSYQMSFLNSVQIENHCKRKQPDKQNDSNNKQSTIDGICKLSRVEMIMAKQFFKIVRNAAELVFLHQQIDKINKQEKENKQKLMKVWILLQKYNMLRPAKQAYMTSILTKQSNIQFQSKLNKSKLDQNIKQQCYHNIINCLEQKTIKQAYQAYWGKLNKPREFRKGLAELNRFRKQCRKISV